MRYQGMRMGKERQSLPFLRTVTNCTATSSPFYVPSDEEIFGCQQSMNKTKKQQFYRKNKLKIWQRPNIKEGLTIKDINQIGFDKSLQNSFSMNYPVNLMKAAKVSLQNNIIRSQPVHRFLKRKRQMLLYQMRIEHKRQQITKLESSAKNYQDGLKQAQAFLEGDIQNFNIYLNQNKLEARTVIKNSEQKTKQKNEVIKILKDKLQVKTDLTGKINSKIEVLQNLIKYKSFLDDFKKPNKFESEQTTPLKLKTQNSSCSEQISYLKKNFILTSELQNFLESTKEGSDLVFQNPEQMMKMFVNLQEANLSCITILKGIEEKMQVVKSSYRQKKQKMTAKKQELINNKLELLKQVNVLDKDIQYLKSITYKQQKQLQSSGLQNQIFVRYQQFFQKNVDYKTLPLQLLKDIQRKLEFFTQQMQLARDQKPIFVQNLEKNCFLQKRQKKKIKIESECKEAAKQNSSEGEPIRYKRARRPIMTKHKIVKGIRVDITKLNQPSQEQIDRRKYFS